MSGSGYQPINRNGRISHFSYEFPRLLFWAVFVGLIAALPACITSQRMMDNINGHYYKYTFAVREATTRKKSADFEKDGFFLHFDPQYNRVNFDFKNKSNAPISIVWSKTLIITNSDSSGVLHAGIPLSDRFVNMPPTVVAAGASYSDFILPLDLIQKEGDHQTIKDIYAEKDDALSVNTDWIMGQIGRDIFAVQFTLQIDGHQQVLPFHFYPIVMQRGAKSFKPQYRKSNP